MSTGIFYAQNTEQYLAILHREFDPALHEVRGELQNDGSIVVQIWQKEEVR